jgi:hypothetical protein
MPRGTRIPDKGTATPESAVWRAGTRLYRVHDHRFSPEAMNPTVRDPHFGGARFDSTPNDVYPYLYAAPTQLTALAETLLRDMPFDGNTLRLLPRRAVSGRRLSQVELTVDVRLVSLVSMPDLNAVQQDDWLVDADAPEYPFTRRWGHWLRESTDWAQGFVWMSKRDRPQQAIVLFGDRFPSPGPDGGSPLRPTGEPPLDLGSPEGIDRLNAMFRPYRTMIAPASGPATA